MQKKKNRKKEYNKKVSVNNYKIILFTVISILALLTLLFTSFSMFFSNATSASKDLIKTGGLTVSFDDSMGSEISINPAKPVTDSYGKTTTPYTFKIKNNGTINATYKVVMSDITKNNPIYENLNDLPKNNIRYQLDDNDPDTLSNITDENKQSSIVSGILPAGESITHTLRLWISHDATLDIAGLVYFGNLSVSGKSVNNAKLSRELLNINTVKNNPNFSNESSDIGLFIEQGNSTKSIDASATYYFRGNVVNNYVQFGKYQTTSGGNIIDKPIIWRIVRVNEDNTVRLISENVISDEIAWNSLENSKYVNSDGSDSTIKATVENWYNSNIGNTTLDTKVEIGNFCNDNSMTDSVYNSKTRIESNNPTFICSDNEGKVQSKVGIITADEMLYAGVLFNSSVINNITYLNNETNFWTITPQLLNMSYLWDYTNKYLTSSITSSTSKIRAVINLKSSTIIERGSGTKNKPFIIKD